MVLIIRNNRIQSRRHSKIKALLSYVVRRNEQKACAPSNKLEYENKLDGTAMSLASVLGVLFLYSAAMFTLPFAAFFGMQHIMKTEFYADRFTTNCVSVLAAVIVVNIIIMSYAYRALHEPDDTKMPNELVVEQRLSSSSSKSNLDKKDD